MSTPTIALYIILLIIVISKFTRNIKRTNALSNKIFYLIFFNGSPGVIRLAVMTKNRDRKAAFRLLKCLMKKYDRPVSIVSGRLQSYRTTFDEMRSSVHH